MKTRPQNTVSSARDSRRSSSLQERRITRLFCLKCFSKFVSLLAWTVSDLKTYRRIDLSPRLKVVKHFTATVNCLAVEELLNQPEKQGGLALFLDSNFCQCCAKRQSHRRKLTVVGENGHDIQKIPDVDKRRVIDCRSGLQKRRQHHCIPPRTVAILTSNS